MKTGTTMVYSENTVVFPFQGYGSFSLFQSSLHDAWVRLTTSTFEDRLGYRPSDCFETFPLPKCRETHPVLEAAGKDYYDYRAALMIRNNAGLTKTYNRFHDPNERHPDIIRLRELHAAMDRAVLDAYGWTNVPTDCEFLLDYEIDEEEWGDRKKPYRYRWPDDVRDDVLARLLELNAERARQEQISGAAAEKKVRRKRSANVVTPANKTATLFPLD